MDDFDLEQAAERAYTAYLAAAARRALLPPWAQPWAELAGPLRELWKEAIAAVLDPAGQAHA